MYQTLSNENRLINTSNTTTLHIGAHSCVKIQHLFPMVFIAFITFSLGIKALTNSCYQCSFLDQNCTVTMPDIIRGIHTGIASLSSLNW